MFGSYFSMKGTINQAAAGIGALPPQAAAGYGALPPQAAAGFGAYMRPARGGFGNDAPLPRVSTYRDGVFGQRWGGGRGGSLHAWRDGVFGPMGAVDATANAPTYDMADAEALKQFKLVLNYLLSSPGNRALTDAAIDTAAYGEETEKVYQSWAQAQTALGPSSLMQTVSGHVVPTATGLYHLFAQGIAAAAGAGGTYAATYWPMPFAYKSAIDQFGPAGSVIPPKFDGSGRESSYKASTLLAGGAAVVLVFGAYAMMRKKRR